MYLFITFDKNTPFVNYQITKYMKKIIIVLVVLSMGTLSAFGQGKTNKENRENIDTVVLDQSFEDAGTNPTDRVEFHLVPKFYKAGDLAQEQPIALSRAKKEAVALAKNRHSSLRKDCLNIIYTVDPIYNDDGSITGAIKGTILIKWSIRQRLWNLSYLKYQLVNIDQNAVVYMLEAD
jgi:hypothetical protein